jgi:outer membrane protein OmpA-like peptidoglycan-associated protein/opacity protein-like surface antigen
MRKLAIAVALSSTVLATPALARDGAWYVGGDFGAMIVEDVEFDVGATEDAIIVDHEYGYDGAGFVGYDLGSFRLEAEVAYKKARIDEIETVIGLPGAVGQGRTIPQTFVDAGGGNTTALSFMVNGMLDFGDDEGISGFLGGGVGIARVNFNNQRQFSNQGAFIDDSDTRFAWQLVAGVRQAISDNMDVTVRYRFFNVSDLDMVGFPNGATYNTRLRTHSLLGGITFNFGGEDPIPDQTCWDGSVIPANQVCPPRPVPPVVVPDVTPQVVPCPNGSSVPVGQTCPVQPIGPFIVFFDWDRADITPQAAGILDNAAAQYQQTGQAQVVLAGHADRSGSDQYNVGLSQRRAEAVRQYLAGRGISEGAMRTEAFGESRPLVETADGVREPQNRRVEITMGPGSGW